MLLIFSKASLCFQPLDHQPPSWPDVALSGFLSPSVPWHSPRRGCHGNWKGGPCWNADLAEWKKMLTEKDCRGCEAEGRSNQGQICLITVQLHFKGDCVATGVGACVNASDAFHGEKQGRVKVSREEKRLREKLHSAQDVYSIAALCCHKQFLVAFYSLISRGSSSGFQYYTPAFALLKMRRRKQAELVHPQQLISPLLAMIFQ